MKRRTRLYAFLIMSLLLVIGLHGYETDAAPAAVETKGEADTNAIPTVCDEHTPKNGTRKVISEATCTQPQRCKAKCNKCGAAYIYDGSPARGHKWGAWKTITENTCTKKGKKQRTCTRTGCTSTESEDIPAGHDWEWKTKTSRTCTESEVLEEKCKRCGHLSGNTKKGEPPREHDWEWKTKTSKTCTEPEILEEKCKECGHLSGNTKEGNPPGHDWDDGIVTEPTCTDDRYTTYTCNRCHSQKKETEPETAYGHVLSNVITWLHFGDGYHVALSTCTICKEEVWLLDTMGLCNCHFHNYKPYYGTHMTQGHEINYYCDCGLLYRKEVGANPDCPYCTTAPEISIITLPDGTILNNSKLSVLSLKAFLKDINGDIISYSAFLDDSTTPFERGNVQSSSNGVMIELSERIPLVGMAEGLHRLKLTAHDPIAPDGVCTVLFTYDNSAPERDSSSITVCSDSISGVFSVKDRFSEEISYRSVCVPAMDLRTECGSDEGWEMLNSAYVTELLSRAETKHGTRENSTQGEEKFYSGSFCFNDPERGAEYVVIVSVTDQAGNEMRFFEKGQTEGAPPEIRIEPHSECCADICINDGISSCRGYVVRAVMDGNVFLVAPDGTFMYIPGPDALPELQDVIHYLYGDENGEKCISVRGLAYGKEYVVSVGRITGEGVIIYSDDKTVICDRNPFVADELAAPAVTAESFEGMITLTWDAVMGATVYDVEIDGKIYTVGNRLSYTQNGLAPGSTYEYRVRGRNSLVNGEFSEYVTKTVPYNGNSEPYEEGLRGDEDQRTDETLAYGMPHTPDISTVKTGKTYVQLSWQPDVNTQYYEVLVNGAIWGNVYDCMITIDGLKPDTDYEITVISHGYADAESEESVASEGPSEQGESKESEDAGDPVPSELTEVSDIKEPAETVSAGVHVHTVAEPSAESVTERRTIVTAASPFAATAGKTYRVAVPVKNVKGNSRYSLELIFDEADVELTDLYEPTPEKETENTAPEGTGLTFTVRNEGGKIIIAAVWETTADEGSAYMMDVLVKSKKTGVIGYEYR